MHQTLLTLHSLNRWLVLTSLVYAIVLAVNGYRKDRPFSKADNAVRHWTATISHIQLILGIYLYLISPIVRLNLLELDSGKLVSEQTFFRFIHISLMITSVVLITIGSAKAKRAETSKLKFRTMLMWFSIALLVILVAIPWPFSPLASRPFFRSF